MSYSVTATLRASMKIIAVTETNLRDRLIVLLLTRFVIMTEARTQLTYICGRPHPFIAVSRSVDLRKLPIRIVLHITPSSVNPN